MEQCFEGMTEDILSHPRFRQLRQCTHHGGENNLYDHLLDTAKQAYLLSKAFRLPEDRVRAVTRAALLHDFFLYDWRSQEHKTYLQQFSGWKRVFQMHAFHHGAVASVRASEYFALDDKQRAAIRTHMFPLAPIPTSREAWIVTLADKIVASKEVTQTAMYSLRRLWYSVSAA